jgi:ubiquinone/menaquinone biosynthesis C-methylase UbiE
LRDRLRHAPELLDAESHDTHVLEQSLAHVAQVNAFLGGASAIRAAITPHLSRDRVTRILDVGTASADLPREIAAIARARGASVDIIATDIHPQMRDIATQRCAQYPEITIGAADALALPFADNEFDIVLLSMTLHHFEDDDPVTAVREAARVGGIVIISELERAWLNYAGARMLGSTWWRGNPLTRHDGPRSVLRAFTRDELADIARAAGLTDIDVQRRWFFRLLLTGRAARSAHA